MTVTIGVEAAGEADAVVVKRAIGEGAVRALRREGERLVRASHPGVVTVVRSAPTTEGWELVMRHGGRPLSTLRGAGVAELASIVAGAASTLADLHELGVTHGRIDASHVLLSDNGRPRLCGFGDGRRAAAPEDDVAMLGRLLAELLGRDHESEPIPDRRWQRRGGWRGWERRALLLLADQATADEPRRRPTARRLAAAMVEAVPAASERGPRSFADGQEQIDPMDRLRLADPATDPRPRRAVATALAIAGVALALAVLPSLRSAPDRHVSRSEVADPEDPRIAEPALDSVVVANGRRYRLGQEGDRILIDDWACDGEPTPAAFRPSTHEVFVFERWADDEPLAVEAIAKVPHAVAMTSATGRDGCPTLSLRTRDGDLVPVSLKGVR